MTVRFARPRDPRNVPEHVLWRLANASDIVEARVRMTPIGPELRVFMRRDGGELRLENLLWSMTFKDDQGGSLGDLAAQKHEEFLRRGWRDVQQPGNRHAPRQ